jgi:hypothetical protein
MSLPRGWWVLGAAAVLLAAGACSRRQTTATDPSVQSSGTANKSAKDSASDAVGFTPSGAAGGEQNPRGQPAEKTPLTWPQPAQSGGPAVLVALTRTPGRFLLYDGTSTQQQEGKNKFTETSTFYLAVGNHGEQEGFDRVSFLRTYLDRSRKETLENGKVIDRIMPVESQYVNLGPNCEFVANSRCYAFDPRNRMGYREDAEILLKDGTRLVGAVVQRDENGFSFLTRDGEQRQVKNEEIARSGTIPLPHILQSDTPHYFFPIFSQRKVAPGETWAIRVPGVIPIERGDGRAVLPTQFEIRMVGRLREVRGAGNAQVAVVDYQYTGTFDSSQEPFTERFSPEFRERNRVVHSITGQGSTTVQLTPGRILDRQEEFTVHLTTDSSVTVSPNTPAKEEHQRATYTSRLTLKLVPPGTKLRNGEVVPPYD